MRANQAALQLGPEFDRDVPGCQRSKASGHPIMRLLIIGQCFDDFAGFANLGPGLVGDNDLRVVSRYCYHVLTGDRADADRDAALVHVIHCNRPTTLLGRAVRQTMSQI